MMTNILDNVNDLYTKMRLQKIKLIFLFFFCFFLNQANAFTSSSILNAMDIKNPGKGWDFYGGVQEHAMIYAIHSSTAAMLGKDDLAKVGADWLVQNSQPGWGMGFEYDSFGDSSNTPADAVYAITVAWGVRALLDIYAITGEKTYADTALEVLWAFKAHFKGFFPYSDFIHE